MNVLNVLLVLLLFASLGLTVFGFIKPEKFEFYLEAFKYGMPPEGGLAIGLERMTAKLLDIDKALRDVQNQ